MHHTAVAGNAFVLVSDYKIITVLLQASLIPYVAEELTDQDMTKSLIPTSGIVDKLRHAHRNGRQEYNETGMALHVYCC